MFPLVRFDVIDHIIADAKLVEWQHWLGGCNRPFGRQSFGLFIADDLVSVAVSASTVNAMCGGRSRGTVVELARQASAPHGRQFTRVCVRLWRELAPLCWGAEYWPVEAVVSYSNRNRHLGDIYRFDGWTKVADVRGGHAGVNTGWTRPRQNYEAKSVWVYEVVATTQPHARIIVDVAAPLEEIAVAGDLFSVLDEVRA